MSNDWLADSGLGDLEAGFDALDACATFEEALQVHAQEAGAPQPPGMMPSQTADDRLVGRAPTGGVPGTPEGFLEELARMIARYGGMRVKPDGSIWLAPPKPMMERGQRFPRADGTGPATGICVSGPPLMNPLTGRPFKGLVMGLSIRDSGTLVSRDNDPSAGSVVLVKAGDGYHGAQITRVCMVSTGAPMYIAAGGYGNIHVEILSTTQTPIQAQFVPTFQWTDSDVLANANANAFLQHPLRVHPGPVTLRDVPEGAVQAVFQDPVTVTWSEDQPINATFTQVVAAGAQVPVQGNRYTLSAGTTVRFLLAPL